MNTDDSETSETRGRIQQAVERRKASEPEPIEQALERIGAMKFSDKERDQFKVAKSAILSGEIGNLRKGNGKLTKSDVLRAGVKILRKQAEAERKTRIAETLRTKPDNYFVITDDSELPHMIERLREEVRRQRRDPWFQRLFRLFDDTLIRRKLAERGIDIPTVTSFTVWDTETSGVDTMIDMTGGYSFWLPLLNEGYYVAYGHLTDDPQCTRSAAVDVIRAFMAQEQYVKAFHNAEFDLAMFLNDGLSPKGFRYDSMDAQFILYDHEESYGLKELFTKYKPLLGPIAAEMDDYTFEDLFGNGSPMPYSPEVVGIYAIKDTHKGWLLAKWQIDTMIKTDDLHVPYFEIRQYLPQVNVNIERTGFEVDLEEMAKLETEFKSRLEATRQTLFDTYQIDDDFLRKMSDVIAGDKIRDWCTAQGRRIKKQAEMLERCRSEIKTANPATKKYTQLAERIKRYETNPLAEAIPENAPDFIREFNLDSNAHIAYLIYDHLGIRDRTKEIVRDKKRERAVSKDVLERYFDEEESLRPLAEYSKLGTLLGTFVEKIPQALDVDGRIHTRLRTVSTGRYGSAGYTGKPNDILDRFKVSR